MEAVLPVGWLEILLLLMTLFVGGRANGEGPIPIKTNPLSVLPLIPSLEEVCLASYWYPFGGWKQRETKGTPPILGVPLFLTQGNPTESHQLIMSR